MRSVLSPGDTGERGSKSGNHNLWSVELKGISMVFKLLCRVLGTVRLPRFRVVGRRLLSSPC